MELDTQLFGIDHWQGDEQAGLYGEEVFEIVNSYNEEFYPKNLLYWKWILKKHFNNLKINL